MNTKEQAAKLRELLGDEYKVIAGLMNYTWDVINISKGDKEINLFTRDITNVLNPKTGKWSYVETIPN